MNPYRLETLVADIFKANHSHAEVIHVGKPHDGGVDVFFVDADQKQWLIQVKRREKANSTEPVETIRNLLGTMLLEGACHGIVVSTADRFSYQAYQAVNRAEEVGMTVKLIDRGILNRMLEAVLPNVFPWLMSLVNSYAEFPADSFRKIPDPNYQQLTLW
ncbi:restriction endonuclease [Oscillatoria sp. FACHB-1406]|uniref:restriction endonuclease n=1 Tax=Oscillatoria sp. FACHB-1406 TaxID=2692846 RepID=UPI001689BEAC|nr:restriction endonuclease [Oscillatoria sp. FACHB-1406]MBD2580163.1 restriction endonuclease [Oscillatoria sp. FACHB-1406]